MLWYLTVFTFMCYVSSENAQTTRNVSTPVVNPDCKSCDGPWVVHVAAAGENNTIHHIWGMHGTPSFITTLTDLSSQLHVNWTKLKGSDEKSLYFDTDPLYTFGFIIPNLILYNDKNDKGKLDGVPEEDRVTVPLSDFEWQVKEEFNENNLEAGGIFETVKFRGELLPNDTRITIQLAAYGVDGRSTVLPHLLRTPDSSQFDIVLDHLILNVNTSEDLTFKRKSHYVPIGDFAKPRWAMDVIIFTSEESADEQTIQLLKQKSLDDENTPGVFHLDEITTPQARHALGGAYMQWRPVSYLTSKREIEHSTFPNIGGKFTPLSNISEAVKISLAYGLLGKDLLNGLTAKTSVAFGQPKDDFYTGSNYTTWTVAVGLGSPPLETFSSMVIIVISLGVGIPVLMFLVGGIVLASRRCRHSQDELLLN